VAPRSRQQVRITGGDWRSRAVSFPSRPGLRPTPDRVRETLFNWLAPVLPGARVLDLCAGSGVLGFEALSRGAREAVLLESDKQTVEALHLTVDKLAANAQVLRMDARLYLNNETTESEVFDVVFIDPPFESELQSELCYLLAQKGWLRSGAHVYVESNAKFGALVPPEGWDLHREKRAGQVGYRLFGTV
jgi:16S rRNA (guanine966-N2)-methyltransferase